jgi:NAD(P)-dependent dehydrogenase (short-subunit alcohol dehydrogenase family)
MRHTAATGWGTDAYGVSKAALNALTRILARELVPRRIRVNSTCPGWVRTDMGGRNAPRSVKEGTASVLFGVTLPEDGPTGKFYRDGREIAP